MIALQTKLFFRIAFFPCGSFKLIAILGNNAIAGMPRLEALPTAQTNRSMEYLKTPGMAATGSSISEPSQTNNGQIRSSIDTLFSWINRRDQSVLRFLRMRVVGKEGTDIFDPSLTYCLLSYLAGIF
jgi:hypothetical protein